MGAFIGKLFGGDVVGGVSKIIGQFHMSPEEKVQADQFKQFLIQHTDEFNQQMSLEFSRLAESDRASARSMQVSIKSVLPPLLALLVTTGFFGLIYILAYHEAPSGSIQILYAMVGVLGTAWVSIMAYYFGSSSGSTAKSETLSNLITNSGGKK